MNIVKKHNFNKSEDISVIPFLEYYYQHEKEIIYMAIKEDGEKRPDYYIEKVNCLIEIKEIHDKDSNERTAQWSKILSKIQTAVQKNKLLKSVKGTFLVNTPDVFKTPTEETSFNEASAKILNAIINNRRDVDVYNVRFEITKISNQEHIVSFGSFGSGGSIDPSNIVYKNIKDKVTTANAQLGNPPKGFPSSKKILLLVNKYFFPLCNWDLFKAIAKLYVDLLTYENIDEIWYQLETKDKGFIHKLLYKRDFFKQFEDSKLSNFSSDDLKLFANWFSVLAEMGEEKKNKLLVVLKVLLKNTEPRDVFPDKDTRIEMVRLGLWLAEKGMYCDLEWLIKKFINDSDPPDPEKYTGDKAFNYNRRILDNERVNIITTVLGHLAWDIQKLADKKDYIVKSFKFTKKLLSHRNLYVHLQATIPLIHIVARRQWLEEYDKQNKTNYIEGLHEIVFNLLRKYTQYKAFSAPLTHIFYYYKDLNTDDALEVVNYLKEVDEAAPILIYFAIFRERHFKNPDRTDKSGFKPAALKKEFISVINSNDNKYSNIQGSIIWNFWKLLQEQPSEFKVIKPYIDLFSEKPYQKNCYDDLERIVEDWIEREPKICIAWYRKILTSLSTYIKTNKEKARVAWISPEKIIVYIAVHDSKKLLPLVSILVDLWKKGSFVGSPKDIFESYRLVKDVRLKKTIKKQMQKWYIQMKKMNPKIQKVDWE